MGFWKETDSPIHCGEQVITSNNHSASQSLVFLSPIDLIRSWMASGCSGSRCLNLQIFMSWFLEQTWRFKNSKQILASFGANGLVSYGSHSISSLLRSPLRKRSAIASGWYGTRWRKRQTRPFSIRWHLPVTTQHHHHLPLFMYSKQSFPPGMAFGLFSPGEFSSPPECAKSNRLLPSCALRMKRPDNAYDENAKHKNHVGKSCWIHRNEVESDCGNWWFRKCEKMSNFLGENAVEFA